MRSYAPKVSDNIIMLAEQIDKQVQRKKENGQFNSILEVLIDSWVSGRIVKIIQNDEKETELAPYFIGFREEDDDKRNPISVTGRLRHTQEIVTIDIGTIVSAKILNETYTIPDNLRPFKLPEKDIDQYTAVDTIPLKLKVKETSALNVFHSLAHTDEKIEQQEGYQIVSFNVENSIMLTLKIIQCGTGVEILGPEGYRRKFCKFLSDILSKYQN
jgi:hypothetical protein